MKKKNKALYLPVFLFITAFILLTAFSGCMMPGKQGYEGWRYLHNESPASIRLPGLESLWNERTIILDSDAGRGSFSPFSGNRMQGGKGGYIPVHISATLIDSLMILNSLDEFARLAEMNAQEKDEYMMKFEEINKTKDHTYIWLELSTPYTREILNPDKWSIYLTNEKGNQIEPEEILEVDESDLHSESSRLSGIKNPQMNGTAIRAFRLYFSSAKLKNLKMFTSQTKFTEMVLYSWDSDMNYRGRWMIHTNGILARNHEK